MSGAPACEACGASSGLRGAWLCSSCVLLHVAMVGAQVRAVPELVGVTGLGRDELVARLERVARERDLYLANLSAVQGRCTELLDEVRALRREREEAAEFVISDEERRAAREAETSPAPLEEGAPSSEPERAFVGLEGFIASRALGAAPLTFAEGDRVAVRTTTGAGVGYVEAIGGSGGLFKVMIVRDDGLFGSGNVAGLSRWFPHEALDLPIDTPLCLAKFRRPSDGAWSTCALERHARDVAHSDRGSRP